MVTGAASHFRRADKNLLIISRRASYNLGPGYITSRQDDKQTQLFAENLPVNRAVESTAFRASPFQPGSQISAVGDDKCPERAVDAFFCENQLLSLLPSLQTHNQPLFRVQRVLHLLDQQLLELTESIGDYLTCALTDCSVLDVAFHAILSLPHTVISWSALISAYTHTSQGKEALKIHQYMQQEGISPNCKTYINLFKACASIPDLASAKMLHFDAQRDGLVSNVCVSSALIYTYGKCNDVLEAENVFRNASQLNVVVWNSMLSAYLELQQGEKALLLYRQMQEEGWESSDQTFVIALSACHALVEQRGVYFADMLLSKIVSLDILKALHADAWRKGVASNSYIGSTLVALYGKFGSIFEAEIAFASFMRNVVCWNVMLSAYIQQGQPLQALKLFRQMQEEKEHMNHQTLVVVTQACGAIVEYDEANNAVKTLALEVARALHCKARRKSCLSNVFICNTLISVYSKCGCIADAINVFLDSYACPFDVVSWNLMLSAYIQQGEGRKALQLYSRMLKKGLSPNKQTYVIALQAYEVWGQDEGAAVQHSTKSLAYGIAKAVHDDARLAGLALDAFVGSALITVYGKCGNILEARSVFENLAEHDIVSWNAMLSAYLEQELGNEALKLYRQMEKEGVVLSDITSILVLQACFQTGDLNSCQEIHFKIVFAGFDLDLVLMGILINTYGNCASMTDAQAVFDALMCPDMVSWTSCITGYAQAGDAELSFQTFGMMCEAHAIPSGVTFLSLLCACSHTGLVNKSAEYFEFMNRIYGLAPGPRHFSALIDAVGRTGDFDLLENLLLGMAIQACMVDWQCLLGACVTHCNIDMVKHAFHLAIQLHPEDAAIYVSMSNARVQIGLQELMGVGD